MDDNMLNELWESICKGITANPCFYKFYQLLATYYTYKGNFKQAYICLRQALLYCDNDTDRSEIIKGVEDLKKQGAFVPKTAIVILSWNLKDYTAQCINSVRKTTLPEDTQIIVVDNASNDGSVEWLREQKDIILRCNEENEGFPRGCNQGIELADPDADIFLLNNDTVLPPNALFWLKMGLYENDRTGSVGAMSNYVSNYQMIEEEFDSPQEVLDYALSHNVPLKYPYEPKIYLVGFALLLKRTVLDEVGLLDERFSPGNSEDVDIGIRIRMAGYENILCKNSVILHFGSQSFTKLGDEFKAVMLKNIDKLNEKYNTNMRYYLFPRKELISYFESNEEDKIRVLELGCGTGASLAWIRGRYPNAEVYGIEIVADVAKIASSVGNVICANAETLVFPYEEDFFDYCIMGDVLEHLHEPSLVLKKLSKCMKPDGKIMVSMPNMKHWSVMLPLLINDRFRYEDAGILDRTHLRMYTGTEIKKLIRDSGFDIVDTGRNCEGECPKEYKHIIDAIAAFDRTDNKDAYDVYQFIVVAKRSAIKKELDDSKICFISAVNDDEMYEKCLSYISNLRIPMGMYVDTLAVREAPSMTAAYNAAMTESDAKYKIYLHQDVMITDEDFLVKMKESFDLSPDIGISGVVGAKRIPKDGIWWNGSMQGVFTDSHTPDEKLHEYKYTTNLENPIDVEALDGIILCTQYDVTWREDIFDKWHFYDVSQCMEFLRRGLRAVVLPSDHSMIEHHCGVASMTGYDEERLKFVAEYI